MGKDIYSDILHQTYNQKLRSTTDNRLFPRRDNFLRVPPLLLKHLLWNQEQQPLFKMLNEKLLRPNRESQHKKKSHMATFYYIAFPRLLLLLLHNEEGGYTHSGIRSTRVGTCCVRNNTRRIMCSWLIMHRGQRPSALLNQEHMIVSVLFSLNHDE